MTKTHEPKSYKFRLYNGGELFVNKLGSSGWSVDVWDLDTEPTNDPTYHAWYGSREEALADAESWRKWPEDGLED